MQTKAIIFDIDGTLTKNSSWNYITEYLGASWDRHKELLAEEMSGTRTDGEVAKDLLQMWMDTGKATKEHFEKAFQSISLRGDAVESVSELKKQYHLCTITGSMDIFAEIISERVGIKEYYFNTTLVLDGNGNLTEINYDKNQGKKKVEQLDQFCNRHGLTPEECVVVGDSKNNIPLFEYAGKGIFIKSDFEDSKLEKYAWKTIDSLSELSGALS